MKKDHLHYRGYAGSVDYSAEDKCLFGRVLFIRDLILYEGDCVDSLEQSFRGAVDGWLARCAEQGIAPEKPCKGSFSFRPGAPLHYRAASLAQQRETSLNALVTEALARYLEVEEGR